MKHLPDIETLDKDGAIREAAEKVSGDSRRSFLLKAGVTGAAAGATLGGIGAFAFGQATTSGSDNLDDLEILNFALVLEYLESAFYKEAVDKGGFSGEVGTYAKTLNDHEVAHVEALKAAISAVSTPVPEPSFDFGNTTSDEATFLETSITLEDTGVGAYLGAAPSIESAEYLAVAGSILVVEAMHTAWGKTLIQDGPSPAPDVFGKPLTVAQVLDAVGETGFITSELPSAITSAAESATPTTAG